MQSNDLPKKIEEKKICMHYKHINKICMHYTHIPNFWINVHNKTKDTRRKKSSLTRQKLLNFAGKNSFQQYHIPPGEPFYDADIYAIYKCASAALHVVLHETFANSPPFDWELLYLSHWSSGRKCGITAANAKQRIAAVPTHQALCGIPNTNPSQTA